VSRSPLAAWLSAPVLWRRDAVKGDLTSFKRTHRALQISHHLCKLALSRPATTKDIPEILNLIRELVESGPGRVASERAGGISGQTGRICCKLRT
jgi:hypothetical protein